MRKALMAGAISLALAGGGLVSAGERQISPTSAGRAARLAIAGAAPGSVTLYDQNSNDAGSGTSSQNFETSFDAYDDQAADDFSVPSGHVWLVTEVDVTGIYYNGPGPAVSENVFFYKDSGGLPGSLVKRYSDLPGQDNGSGSFRIKLPTHARLKKGHYWVSVQVNMDFSTGGQWGWEDSAVVNGDPAAWQNPGDGFGTGCTAYRYKADCGLAPVKPDGGTDQMFALKGKVKI